MINCIGKGKCRQEPYRECHYWHIQSYVLVLVAKHMISDATRNVDEKDTHRSWMMTIGCLVLLDVAGNETIKWPHQHMRNVVMIWQELHMIGRNNIHREPVIQCWDEARSVKICVFGVPHQSGWNPRTRWVSSFTGSTLFQLFTDEDIRIASNIFQSHHSHMAVPSPICRVHLSYHVKYQRIQRTAVKECSWWRLDHCVQS